MVVIMMVTNRSVRLAPCTPHYATSQRMMMMVGNSKSNRPWPSRAPKLKDMQTTTTTTTTHRQSYTYIHTNIDLSYTFTFQTPDHIMCYDYCQRFCIPFAVFRCPCLCMDTRCTLTFKGCCPHTRTQEDRKNVLIGFFRPNPNWPH